ncbi:dihydrolipoyllysine-residue succinyltransferase [Denitrificimonas sp. JX-1]|uniref:Dihydrolipoyllysine-residue succinyltransferase component of 2-oxoglutarate dehydrogenase complex n=1 Tax=Denitrificimonas halotolerans TaxID=3098930 RepID=A0ABU5GUD7_9GAMM|nr:dihydrolipoyllysine-residue succinyltransferase [Denitrificimonas sp. JX-1]MDY7220127.1 dihydrolipoyllysine-residue succinyltransferase [Denitrificimonas sp. JX-1]
MAIEIKAPAFPESVADGTVATWHKQVGEAVKRDELIVDIETDKVVMEVLAEADGVITEIVAEEGATVLSGELLGKLDTEAVATAPAAPAAEVAVSEPAAAATAGEPVLSPAARKIAAENALDPAAISGTGKDGRVTKEDAVAAAANKPAAVAKAPAAAVEPLAAAGDRIEKRVPMTRLRARVAERLVEAQSNMAMLTTFNEVNMKPIMDLRNKYKDLFEKTHNGVRLGFMSFFVKAATEALKRQPGVNASIDGNDIVYHGYQDIGVAVSSDRGLVVPVLRNAEFMSLAEIEGNIRDLGLKARDGKLTIEEMTGGTFTISNGGVFGSLLSTPIVNPPQTAILGMHKIQERPMAVDGEVVILPMMYLALSYDHRLIDGKEAVTFLVTMKDLLEDPARLLLDI